MISARRLVVKKNGIVLHRWIGDIPKDIAMPTPLSVGFDIKLHRVNDSTKPRKVAVVAGWLGAKGYLFSVSLL